MIAAVAGGGGGGDCIFPRFAYAANSGDDTISIYRLDSVTGLPHHHGYAVAGDEPVSVTVDRLGRFAYVANKTGDSVRTFSIDAEPTGRFVFVATRTRTMFRTSESIQVES